MALTGTPLINDIEDFRAIWQFLGWIDDKKPLGELMEALEQTGLTPADPGFYPAARAGRHRPAASCAGARSTSPPTSRPAASPTCRSSSTATSAARSARPSGSSPRAWCSATTAALATRTSGGDGRGHRPRAGAPGRHAGSCEDADEPPSGENVFSDDAPDRPGQGRPRRRLRRPAGPQRRQGRVLRQAHRRHGRGRGDLRQARHPATPRSAATRPPTARQRNIDAFVNDPDVAIAVCSLTAAGVGLNLQVASNVVLAELSWTDAEQTQAIDRVHRIGQDRAGHRLADHRGADHRHQDRRAHRQQGRPRRPRARRLRRGGLARRPTSSSRRWWRC